MKRLLRHITEFQMAFLLLTRLPAGRLAGNPPELAAASWAFPLAGVAVGCGIGGSYMGFVLLGLPALLAAWQDLQHDGEELQRRRRNQNQR